MGKKNKLQRFAELKTFHNVVEKDPQFKGKWGSDFFKNNHPITLELACGKGEYTLALAKRYPGRNFIGVDLKGNRIWKGAKAAIEEQLPNIAFLRIQIEQITDYFSPGEIAEIWITFPDPFIKKSKANKRLTSPLFLELYKKILQPNGLIHLKTDEVTLYHYTLETIRQNNYPILHHTDDLYHAQLTDEILSVKTFYELQHLQNGKTIKYLSFLLQHSH